MSDQVQSMNGFARDSYDSENFVNYSLSNKTIKSVEFEGCEFNSCSFIDCKFEKCKFIDCHFKECTLSAINPVNSQFADLKFSKCKVMGIDWTKASQIYGLDFTECQISYSNFAMLKLPKMKMINCEAKETDFTESDLSEGSFTGTDFERSVFARTNLTKANLKGAVNYGIDPRHNTLKQAHFSLPEALSLLNSLDIIID